MTHTTNAGIDTMTAVVQNRYGPPATLTLGQIPTPAPNDGEVLVRVHAAAVTPSDCAFRQGKPLATRLFNGLRRPRHVLGSELAGEVIQLGAGVRPAASGPRRSSSPSISAPRSPACATPPEPPTGSDSPSHAPNSTASARASPSSEPPGFCRELCAEFAGWAELASTIEEWRARTRDPSNSTPRRRRGTDVQQLWLDGGLPKPKQ